MELRTLTSTEFELGQIIHTAPERTMYQALMHELAVVVAPKQSNIGSWDLSK